MIRDIDGDKPKAPHKKTRQGKIRLCSVCIVVVVEEEEEEVVVVVVVTEVHLISSHCSGPRFFGSRYSPLPYRSIPIQAMGLLTN